MKTITLLSTLVLAAILSVSCSKTEKAENVQVKHPAKELHWSENPGVGPISQFELPDNIDQNLAAKGAEIYGNMCTACHKVEKRFIGPSPKGILERRSPAWIMNMILNPQNMVKEDPIAKQLLIEFNGAPMANQNLTEDQARAILEYFRTL